MIDTSEQCPVCGDGTIYPTNSTKTTWECATCGYQYWEGRVLRVGYAPSADYRDGSVGP